MFNSIAALVTRPSEKRPFKVRGIDHGKRFGIVAKNYDDAVKKGKEKLKIEDDVQVTVRLEEDATVVSSNDYFNTLQPQSVLVFLRPGESFMPDIEKAILGLNALLSKRGAMEDIVNFLRKEETLEKLDLLVQLKEVTETKVEAEKREEDNEWFEGLDKKYKTKAAYMKNLAQKRMRSYYTSAKAQIQEEKNAKVKAELLDLCEKMNSKLKENDLNGHYFNRHSNQNERLCDENGRFICEGPFDETSCGQSHAINPYASRHRRLYFSLWNLDHIIEKKREIIPKIIEAARKKEKTKKELNFEEVYKLLFTKNNLKLVHYECHKKAARVQSIDSMELASQMKEENFGAYRRCEAPSHLSTTCVEECATM